MATLKEVKRLIEEAEMFELEGRALPQLFTNTDLGSIYNGIGPESFPGWLRAFLDKLHPSLAVVAFIHDIEWFLSDGSRESFTDSNKRFRRNGFKVARAKFAWYRPRRYIVMWDAWKFARICQRFGWAAWMAGYTARDVEEMKKEAEEE